MRYVYFAKCGDNIKVGVAANVLRRITNLRVGSAAPIELLAFVVASERLERELHKRLRPHRVRGEWFKDCPEVRAAMDECTQKYDAAAPFKPERDKTFGNVCRILWSEKTAAQLAAMSGRDERTAKRWLSGEFDPPPELAAPILARIFPPKRK